MPIVKIPARDFTAEINTGTEGAPVWVEIQGLTSLTPNFSKNDADITDFSSGGHQAHIPISFSRSFTLEGQRLEDPATGDRDPGQAAVEALAGVPGYAGLGQFRITSPGGETYTFKASVNVTPFGGGKDDISSWSAELTVSGAITIA